MWSQFGSRCEIELALQLDPQLPVERRCTSLDRTSVVLCEHGELVACVRVNGNLTWGIDAGDVVGWARPIVSGLVQQAKFKQNHFVGWVIKYL